MAEITMEEIEDKFVELRSELEIGIKKAERGNGTIVSSRKELDRFFEEIMFVAFLYCSSLFG